MSQLGSDTVAYIAGLFDGEGCVTCKQKPTKRADRGDKIYKQWYIRCEISMTDKYVIDFIQETLGFGWSGEKKYTKRPKHYKRQWRWSCGYRDALLFAKLMWPYAQVKLHKLEQIIDHYETYEPDRKNVINLESYRREQNARSKR